MPGGTRVAVVPNGTAPALNPPYLPGQYTEYPAAVQDLAQQALLGGGSGIESGSNTTRRQAFREAKEAAGIPKSAEYKTHKFVFDGTSENRIVYEFDVCGEKKYIIEHPFDKMGRGNHFHGADDTKGSPFSKGRYNQYPGHFPEDFNGFN